MSHEQSSGLIGRRRAIVSLVSLLAASSAPTTTLAFSPQRRQPAVISRGLSVRLSLQSNDNIEINDSSKSNNHKNKVAASLLALSLATATPLLATTVDASPAFAYEESDYASETVTTVVSRLKSSAGDVDASFGTLEDVAKIITEGKGVGGTLTYDGVRLNEGFIADEDTTIYNPGLSLLTSSEKERLVDAIIQNRKVGLSTQKWSENNEYAFDFLKQKLDPLHMHELKGYLGILPFWGAALYLGALFVQQNSRGIFPLVYGLCALGVFGPIVLLVASGP
mmetsp:Transcript_36875/g.77854  ORF Transcript_36875/g.77854 Transcript_36875/m.77854 type:complete len:280 (-) Transcript_36875:274-1113(-)|eukprot:CAMPEP_0183721198 /NCGR_PEP_ID=MMETSP0737-20130205/13556_1 /TAXON_ID=385413 /ORGANISM="Thalassiosira miniscula, Strain CCMP1093" /LENGTH=279 /DNA_ID=CAMNT_0025951169 /DNA_START=320 /DNA_END=1159 /DNA_ORIENTATION=+